MNMTAASPVFMTEEILAEVSESMAGSQTWMTRRGEVVHEAFSLIMKPEVGIRSLSQDPRKKVTFFLYWIEKTLAGATTIFMAILADYLLTVLP